MSKRVHESADVISLCFAFFAHPLFYLALSQLRCCIRKS